MNPNETVHEYAYDGLGRQIEDAVTAFGSGIDEAVKRITTTYEARGMVATVTSHDALGGGGLANCTTPENLKASEQRVTASACNYIPCVLNQLLNSSIATRRGAATRVAGDPALVPRTGAFFQQRTSPSCKNNSVLRSSTIE